jgi:hypothetical protein
MPVKNETSEAPLPSPISSPIDADGNKTKNMEESFKVASRRVSVYINKQKVKQLKESSVLPSDLATLQCIMKKYAIAATKEFKPKTFDSYHSTIGLVMISLGEFIKFLKDFNIFCDKVDITCSSNIFKRHNTGSSILDSKFMRFETFVICLKEVGTQVKVISFYVFILCLKILFYCIHLCLI